MGAPDWNAVKAFRCIDDPWHQRGCGLIIEGLDRAKGIDNGDAAVRYRNRIPGVIRGRAPGSGNINRYHQPGVIVHIHGRADVTDRRAFIVVVSGELIGSALLGRDGDRLRAGVVVIKIVTDPVTGIITVVYMFTLRSVGMQVGVCLEIPCQDHPDLSGGERWAHGDCSHADRTAARHGGALGGGCITRDPDGTEEIEKLPVLFVVVESAVP